MTTPPRSSDNVRRLPSGITIGDVKDIKLDQERGTADDLNASYRLFDTGEVEDLDTDWTVADMDDMIKRDGKARTLEQVLTLPIRSAEWSIKSTEDPDEEDEVSEQ